MISWVCLGSRTVLVGAVWPVSTRWFTQDGGADGRCPRDGARKALAAGTARWFDDLPALVAGLERDWPIAVGRGSDNATEAFVAEAIIAGGAPVVLKLLVLRSDDAASNEITVLRFVDGVGCARLLRHDEARGALLLERLGRSLHGLALPIGRRHEILCSTASRVWRRAPDCGLPTGLLCATIDLQPVGRQMLAVADRLSGEALGSV